MGFQILAVAFTDKVCWWLPETVSGHLLLGNPLCWNMLQILIVVFFSICFADARVVEEHGIVEEIASKAELSTQLKAAFAWANGSTFLQPKSCIAAAPLNETPLESVIFVGFQIARIMSITET